MLNIKNKKAFGGVASTLIMFIAIIGVTTGLVIAFQNYYVETQNSMKYQQQITNEQLRTIMSITNIYYDKVGKSLSIYVKNVGGTDIISKYMDVFVDGVYGINITAHYAENLTKEVVILKSQETALIKFDIDLSTGTHEARVVTEYGVGVSEKFNIE